MCKSDILSPPPALRADAPRRAVQSQKRTGSRRQWPSSPTQCKSLGVSTRSRGPNPRRHPGPSSQGPPPHPEGDGCLVTRSWQPPMGVRNGGGVPSPFVCWFFLQFPVVVDPNLAPHPERVPSAHYRASSWCCWFFLRPGVRAFPSRLESPFKLGPDFTVPSRGANYPPPNQNNKDWSALLFGGLVLAVGYPCIRNVPISGGCPSSW